MLKSILVSLFSAVLLQPAFAGRPVKGVEVNQPSTFHASIKLNLGSLPYSDLEGGEHDESSWFTTICGPGCGVAPVWPAPKTSFISNIVNLTDREGAHLLASIGRSDDIFESKNEFNVGFEIQSRLEAW